MFKNARREALKNAESAGFSSRERCRDKPRPSRPIGLGARVDVAAECDALRARIRAQVEAVRELLRDVAAMKESQGE